MKDEVYFLPADKHEKFLQIDTIILGVYGQPCPNLPKITSLLVLCNILRKQVTQNSKFAMSLQYLKKEVRDEVHFLHADKHQSFLEVNVNTLDIKFPLR